MIIATLLASTLLTAAPVSKQEAKLKAMQLLAVRGKTLADPQKPAEGRTDTWMQEETATQADIEQRPYYVFNADGGSGFIIMSGDDSTDPVLGYSDHGSFTTDDLPENVSAWLNEYELQIKSLWSQSDSTPTESDASNNGSGPRRVRQSLSLKHSIAPLLPTQWNQGAPYNLYSPNSSVTGCVATAMAQVINFHAQRTGLPRAITNDIPSYLMDTDKTRVSGVPAGTPLSWADMLNLYEYSSINVSTAYKRQSEAVARLMLYCGVAVSMDYNMSFAAARSSDVPYALRHYFGYDKDTRLAQRANYYEDEWEDLLYGELDAERPVYYSGASSTDGHAFVIDGYDGEGLFHINWGWGGHCDGYFRLCAANPDDKSGIGAGSSADGYVMKQQAVIGAKPAAASPLENGEIMLTTSNLFVIDNIITFDAYNLNLDKGILDFEIGIGYLEENGELTPIKFANLENSAPNTGLKFVSFSVMPESKPDGTYKVLPISRMSGTTKWHTSGRPEKNYVEAVFNGSNLTLTAHPVVALRATSVDTGGTAVVGKNQKVRVEVTNEGDEFYGAFYIFAQSLKDNPEVGPFPTIGYYEGVGVYLDPEQRDTVVLSVTPANTGQYHIWITTDEVGLNVIGQATMNVAATGSNESDVNLKINMAMKNVDLTGKRILGPKAIVLTTVVNNSSKDYTGVFVPTILKLEGSMFNPSSLHMQTRHFPAHSTTTLETQFNLDPTGQYYTYIYYESNGSMMGYVGEPYTVAPAVTSYFADGREEITEAGQRYVVPEGAVAVSFIGNDVTINVQPNSNPNCLYFLSEEGKVPTDVTKNIVKGGRSSNITLTDEGLGFYPIRNFTAETISYTRTFDQGMATDNPYWTTITLPFSVDKCYVEQTEAYWSPDSEERNRFWILEYLGEKDGKVNFSPSEQFKGYTPYLISVPGAGLRDLDNLVGKPIKFVGQNVNIACDSKAVVAGGAYKFEGTTKDVAASNGICLVSDDATKCVRTSSNVSPFRAYFAATTGNTAAANIPVNISGFYISSDQKPASGDVNGDGVVDKNDIEAVKAYMMGNTFGVNFKDADVNGDGQIGIADIVAITKLIK